MINNKNDESCTPEGNAKEPRSVRTLPLWMRSSCSKEYPALEASEKVIEESTKVQEEGTLTSIQTGFHCKTEKLHKSSAKAVDEASPRFQYQSENNVGNDHACQREDSSNTNNKTQTFKNHTEASETGLVNIDPKSVISIAVTSAGNVEKIPPSGESCKKNDSSSKAAVDSSEGEIKIENPPRLPRQPCTYGAKCYRKNQTHLDMRSHPGDDDFFDNRPECEYGTSCYRKNILHNQQYKHTGCIARKRKPETQAYDSKNEDDSEPEESDISVSGSDSYEPFDSEELQLSSELEDDGDDEDDEKEKPKLLKRRRWK
ncbi:aprataxin and PNK-like factor [Anabrus simplex]|uniref:aprataxin and PNK-like factor n=1 Tax=Anabrus simplex TaxID=316456 RepID=UPI0035A2E076